jgi:DNA-directed RNA polymerase II subunit RPB1
VNKILDIVVRGIPGIISTNVYKIIKTGVQPDGSIKTFDTYGISTVGSNLSEILLVPGINPQQTQTDSVADIEKVFGIVAARNKIISELRAIIKDTSYSHFTIFADQMTYSGKALSVRKVGSRSRDMSNVMLRLSFQNQIQVLCDASIYGLKDKITAISGPLIVGGTPVMGTTYNTVIVNRDFIKKRSSNMSQLLEEL